MNAEIEENVRKNIAWSQLPAYIKQSLNHSSKEYEKYVISFSIKNQLRYRGNLVRHILKDEKRYYERIIAYSRERLMLFPYHLADMIVKGLRITPFNYYISVVEKLMQAERSYDTLPNFTAADCLRLLGIGRNEYIELMNKSRSNRGRLFGKRNVRGLLPNVPSDIHIEPWWRVEVGLVLEDDIKLVTNDELDVIDKLIDLGSQTAGDLNYNIVLNLYKKGLIYLDVPVTAVDCIQVPPLQGFVMNRVLGDYFETLLYKIFVSIDEQTTVGELAGVLQVNTELVKQAVSLYCRLQFARKLEPETAQVLAKRDPSWCQSPAAIDKTTPLTLNLNNTTPQYHNLNQNNCLSSPSADDATTTNTTILTRKGGHRIAFLFDSTLTAFLMMGNLSPGLKKHAVTMFEVGKLSDESLDSFLTELEKVSLLDAEGEGEARRFFDHAVILRSTVLALRKLLSAGLDLVRIESLHSLDDATCLRLLQKKYKLLVSMAPLNREVRSVVSLSPPHLGPAVPEVNSLWFKLFLYHMTGYGPPSLLLIKGTTLKQLPRMFLGYSRLLITTWLHEPAVIPIANILHVNAALQCSPVLIQAYGVLQTAQTFILPFPFRPDTPSKCQIVETSTTTDLQFRIHPAIDRILSNHIDLEHNCGYITFANVGVLDFGCLNHDPVVRLGRTSSTNNNNKLKQQLNPTTISNENFTFINNNHIDDEERVRLQSPIESHFALTPPFSTNTSSHTSSPANGFTSVECSNLMEQELDQLEQQQQSDIIDDLNIMQKMSEKIATDDDNISCMSRGSNNSLLVNIITSPIEENVNMFSRDVAVVVGDKGKTTKTLYQHSGEIWTLLDCHFGIPLFDVNANTKICDTIVSGGLTEATSLENLVDSNRKMESLLLDFISQCQYYAGENMEIIKRGRLVPLPRHNLVFDNGKVSEWLGK